jgi:flagellar biosynthesis/type III secretory pathway protein FliH
MVVESQTHPYDTNTASWRPPRCDGANSALPQALDHASVPKPAYSVRFLSSTNAGQQSSAGQPASELIEELKQTFEEGYQAGLAEGKKLARSEQTSNSVAALGELLSQVRREAQNVVIELSAAIAERILQKQIEQHPQWVLENARTVLEHQIPNGVVKLRLNPQDRERILANQPPPAWASSSDGTLILVADGDLQPGDCILESERTRVDGRIQNQLDRLREVLQEMVVGTLFPEQEQ